MPHSTHRTKLSSERVIFDVDHQLPFDKPQLPGKPEHQARLDPKHPLFHQPLVNIENYDIAFESYHAISDGSNTPYCKPIQGSRQEGWLRQDFAEKLVKANHLLRQYDAELLIFDAYRPIECQQGLWDFFYQLCQSQAPQASEQQWRQDAFKYVRDPSTFNRLDPRTLPIHITGSAVDVVLRDSRTHQLLDMGCKFEDMSPVSKSNYFESQLNQGLIAQDDVRLLNRRLMDWALTEQDILNDSRLYWHYDWGNPMWCKTKQSLTGKLSEPAWYGFIDNPPWNVDDASLLPATPAQNHY